MSRWQANRRGGEKFASHRRPSANRRLDCVPVVLAVFGTSAGLRGFPIPNSLESPTWIELWLSACLVCPIPPEPPHSTTPSLKFDPASGASLGLQAGVSHDYSGVACCSM